MLSNEFILKIRKLGVKALAERVTDLRETTSGIWAGHCPSRHHEDSTPSFYVFENTDDGGIESWCCRGCHVGPKGSDNNGSDNIAFVQWIYEENFGIKLTFYQTVEKIAAFYHVPMEKGKFSGIYRKNRENMETYESQITPFVKIYLSERGLDDEDIKKWHLGFDGDRITMPIFNSYNEVVGFSNRAFSKRAEATNRKYLNTPEKRYGKDTGFHKGSVLYGIQFVDHADKRLFIFEGQFDAIIASKWGIPNAVAAMTCHLTKEQAAYIAKSGFTPVVCFDPDDAGRSGAMQTMEILRDAGVKDARVLFLPDERDMADLGCALREKTKDVILPRVIPFYQYILKGMADEFDAAVLAKQGELMPKVNDIVASLGSEEERELARNFIQHRFRVWAA